MRKNLSWLVVAFLLGLLLGQPAVSIANSAQTGGYTFCVNKKSGALRQLLKGTCTAKTESTLVMGAEGPQGLPGAQGEPGIGIPFELVDASGNVIPNVVDVKFFPDANESHDFTFTRIVDGNAFRYFFAAGDTLTPELVWNDMVTGFYLDSSCTDGPYTRSTPTSLPPFLPALERIFLIPGDGITWGGLQHQGDFVWGRYESETSLSLEPGARYQIRGGSLVFTDGIPVVEPYSCDYINTSGSPEVAWKLVQYEIPAELYLDFPVTVRWLN